MANGKGRYDEVIAEFLRRKVPTASTNWALGYAYGLAGRCDETRRNLDFLLDLSRRQHIWSGAIAIQYIGLGDNGRSLDIMEKAVAEVAPYLFLRYNQTFRSVSSIGGLECCVFLRSA